MRDLNPYPAFVGTDFRAVIAAFGTTSLVAPTTVPKHAEIFYGLFLRSEKFWLQNSAILRNATRMRSGRTSSVRNGAQAGENPRKNCLLNYETAALPAELRRHFRGKIA
jgi:hypothetical protein